MPTRLSRPTVETPKVIYSAPPVRNVPLTGASKKQAVSQELKIEETVPAEPVVPAPKEVAPGIELNIPVTDVEVTPSMSMPGMAGADMEFTEGDDSQRREKKDKKKKFMRTAAGTTWEDPTLAEWETGELNTSVHVLVQVGSVHLYMYWLKIPVKITSQ